MNTGLRRGINKVSVPRQAGEFNSPTSFWNQRSTAVSAQLNPWDMMYVSASGVICTLPPNAASGDQVALWTDSSRSSSLTSDVIAPPGQTINGSGGALVWSQPASTSAGGWIVFALFMYFGSGRWYQIQSIGNDGVNLIGMNIGGELAVRNGANISGTWTFNNLIQANGGTSTASAAAFTTPTLGAAAQLAQTTKDSILYIVIGTAGTAFTIAIGPTAGVANTLVNSVVATSGTMYTVRLPAGWYIAVTATTATWTTTAQVC